ASISTGTHSTLYHRVLCCMSFEFVVVSESMLLSLSSGTYSVIFLSNIFLLSIISLNRGLYHVIEPSASRTTNGMGILITAFLVAQSIFSVRVSRWVAHSSLYR